MKTMRIICVKAEDGIYWKKEILLTGEGAFLYNGHIEAGDRN